MTRPTLALLVVAAAWILASAAAQLEQRERTEKLDRLLEGRSAEEAAALLDNPAVPVAESIAAAVPETACVEVLAYAGPAAVDYYNARLDYLLYPRRVSVAARSKPGGDDCEYLAIFRDTEQNLAAAPFAGQWDEAQLQSALAGLDKLDSGGGVSIYRRGTR